MSLDVREDKVVNFDGLRRLKRMGITAIALPFISPTITVTVLPLFNLTVISF